MMKERKFLFFINPISGTKKKLGLEELLITSTEAAGFSGAIIYTNAEADYKFLPEKIAKEKITDIIICGGDGSVNQVGQHLIRAETNIGIIPMGSGNGLAFCAGIPKAIDKALKIIFEGSAGIIDGLSINGKFSCMLCGLGLDAQVAEDFAAKGKRGLFNYIRQTTINFIKAKPYPFEISMGDVTIKTDAFFISIANSNQFGNHFTIAPQASLSDGLLDIVVVKKMNKLRMIWSVLKQVKSGQVTNYEDQANSNAYVLYFQTSKLSIRNFSMAPLHIDGEAAESNINFDIEIIPAALRLLQPRI